MVPVYRSIVKDCSTLTPTSIFHLSSSQLKIFLLYHTSWLFVQSGEIQQKECFLYFQDSGQRWELDLIVKSLETSRQHYKVRRSPRQKMNCSKGVGS